MTDNEKSKESLIQELNDLRARCTELENYCRENPHVLEEELKKHNTLLENIINSPSSPSFSVDKNYNYTSFNKSHATAMKILYNADIEIGKNILDYQAVLLDSKHAKKNLDRALKGESFTDSAFSGNDLLNRRYYEVLHNPVYDNNGNIIGISVRANDVTDRKLAEDALRTSEEKFKLLFEASSIGIGMMDLEGNILETNKRMRELTGYSGKKLVVINIFQTFARVDDRTRVKQQLESFGYLRDMEIELCRDDNSVFWALLSIDLIKFEYHLFCLITILDITKRKHFELALYDSEERFRAAFMNSLNAIVISTLEDAVWVDVNQMALDMFGYTREEVIGKSALSTNLWVDQTDRQKFVLELGKTDKVSNHEVQLRRKDGTILNALVSVRTLMLKGVNHLLFETKDITQSKQAENALHESEERYRLLYEQAGIAIGYYTPDGKVISYNDLALKNMNLKRENIEGKSIYDFFPKLDADFYMSRINRALSTEGTTEYEDFLDLPIGGKWFSSIFSKICDTNNNPVGIQIMSKDITETKLSEDALRASEERYRSLFEYSNDAIFIHDDKRNMLDVNRQALEMLGYTREELLALPTIDYHPPEAVNNAKAAFKELVRKDSVQFDSKFLKKDGSVIDVALSVRSIEPGSKIFQAIVRDITDHKLMEEALRHSEATLNKAQRIAHIGSWELDDATHDLRWSDETFRIFGFTPQAFIPTMESFSQCIHPKDHALMQNAITYAWEHRTPLSEDHRIILPTGEERIVHEQGELICDDNGKPEKWMGTVQDITERKRGEADRELMAAAIEQAGEIIIITDKNGDIQYVNPAFKSLTGYSREEVIGFNPRFLKGGKHDEAFYIDLWNTVSKGGTWQGRFINKRKDGTLYTEEATISPVRDGAGNIINYIAVKNDITKQLALEQQLNQAQKMESVGRLAGGVAHDFNNLLTIILANSEIALIALESGSPVKEEINDIKDSSLRAADLTRQLLAFARKQTINPRVLDLNDTITGTLKMLGRLIGENIELVWKPGTNLWPVKVDPSQVDQILANLSVNARDAINGIGILTIETENVFLTEDYCLNNTGFISGEYVMLAVTDNGCGMDTKTIEQIFDPFFTTKELGKGTGLGLSTVYGAVKQNDGFINVYSEPGFGTTFKIYLPRVQVEYNTDNLVSKKISLQGTETIIIAEDEIKILNLGKNILEKHGYTVLAARTPKEILDLAEKFDGSIHLLVTDVIMPEMNGKELRDRLTIRRPGLKTLFISGYTADVITHHGVIDEGVQFLQKPFSVTSFAAKIREVLDN